MAKWPHKAAEGPSPVSKTGIAIPGKASEPMDWNSVPNSCHTGYIGDISPLTSSAFFQREDTAAWQQISPTHGANDQETACSLISH